MSPDPRPCQFCNPSSTNCKTAHQGTTADSNPTADHTGRNDHQGEIGSTSTSRPAVLEGHELLGSNETDQTTTTNNQTVHRCIRPGMGGLVGEPVSQPQVGTTGGALVDKREGTVSNIPRVSVLCRIFRR